MRVEVREVRSLRFDDGAPVRAASAVARFGEGWLIAQDDATHAAWALATSVTRVRVLPPVRGHDVFSEAEGTKRSKPDLEAACEVVVEGQPGVLLLGSGSKKARMRGALVFPGGGRPRVVVADLTPVYGRAADALGVGLDGLNFEGACRVGDALRWYNRVNLSDGRPSASVDLDLAALLAAVAGGPAAAVPVGAARRYDLGELRGVGLGITDAVALPGGRILASAAAEATSRAVDDGRVLGSALVLLDDDVVLDSAPLPTAQDGTAWKIEGLGLLAASDSGVELLAVVDADDTATPSAELSLAVTWDAAA